MNRTETGIIAFFASILFLFLPLQSFAQEVDPSDGSILETQDEFFGEPSGLADEFELDEESNDDLEEEILMAPDTEREYRSDNRSKENIVEEEPVAIGLDPEPLPQEERQRKEIEYRYNSQPIKVYHPNAKKGLIKITKDRKYIYKIPPSPQKNTSSVRFGFYDPKNLRNPETETDFDTLYSSTSNPAILFDYEWDWLKGFGVVGLKVGTGIYTATGNGEFVGNNNPGLAPKEKFTLYALPNSASVTYRAKYWEDQILVPYVEAGADLFVLLESRDDEDFAFKAAGVPAGHAAGGLAFNLDFLSESSLLELDREYGINSLYLTVEFRTIVALKKELDISGDIINGGFMVEF